MIPRIRCGVLVLAVLVHVACSFQLAPGTAGGDRDASVDPDALVRDSTSDALPSLDAGTDAPVTCSNDCTSCGAGGCCTQDCPSGNCPTCRAGCTCDLSCQEDRPCDAICASGSVCKVDGMNNGTDGAYTIHCETGSQCEVTCVGDEGSCTVTCTGTASCLVIDAMQAASSTLTCPGGAMSCPNNVKVCNRACP